MIRKDRDATLGPDPLDVAMPGPAGLATANIPDKRPRKIVVLALCALMLASLAGLAWIVLDDEPASQRARVSRQDRKMPERQRASVATEAPAQAPARDVSAAQDGAQDPMANSVRLPAIASFEPGTVYSGTLGELTRLQAGSQIARADLALAEVRVKLREMERRLADEGTRPDTAPDTGNLEERLRSSISATLKETVQEEMARAMGTLARARLGSLRVIAVRGQGKSLEAELAGPEGRHIVREGARIGGMRVDAISRTSVVVDGSPLPWR